MSLLKYKENFALFLIFVFGILLRYLPFLNELKDSPVLFYQPDNLYYLRRVMTILNNFPSIPKFDYYLNFSEAVDFPSPPFYPFFLAFLSWILSLGNPTQHMVELVSSGVTAISGALILYPIYKILKKFVKEKLALLGGLFSTFMPLHYWYTNSIDGDHHALESLLAFMTFYYYLELIDNFNLRILLKFVTSLILVFLIWQGAILYAGLITLFTVIYVIMKKEFSFAKNIGLSIIFSSILIAGFMIILPPYKPSIDFGRYSFFPPLALLLCGLSVFLIFCISHKKKTFSFIIFLTLILILYLLKDELIKGFVFLLRKEKGFVSVLEMQSILKIGWWKGVIDQEFILRTIFFIYLFTPLGIIFFAFKKKNFNDFYFLYIVYSFAFLTFTQRRFGYIYGPLIASSIVYYLGHINKRMFFKLFSILILIFLLEWGISIGRTKKYFSIFIEKEIKQAYTWLSKNTPTASKDPFDSTTKPDYSVFATWDQGYFLVYYGQRPVIANNALLLGGMESFIDALKLTITTNEETFLQLLNKYKVKYLVINATKYEYGIFDFLNYPYMEPEERIYGILDFNYGLKGENSLSNFRLIAEFLGNTINKRIKIYEYVKGANLKIYIGKNKKATIILKPETPLRKFVFKKVQTADKDGYIFLTLPYSQNQGMVKAPHYELYTDEKSFRFTLSEDSIIKGKSYFIDLTKIKGEPLYLD